METTMEAIRRMREENGVADQTVPQSASPAPFTQGGQRRTGLQDAPQPTSVPGGLHGRPINGFEQRQAAGADEPAASDHNGGFQSTMEAINQMRGQHGLAPLLPQEEQTTAPPAQEIRERPYLEARRKGDGWTGGGGTFNRTGTNTVSVIRPPIAEPPSFWQRVTGAAAGAAKSSAAGYVDAERARYEATQPARTADNIQALRDSEWAVAAAKRAYDNALSGAGADSADAFIAQNTLNSAIEKLRASAGVLGDGVYDRALAEAYRTADSLTGAQDTRSVYDNLARFDLSGVQGTQSGAAKAAAGLADELQQSAGKDIEAARRGAGAVGGLLVDAGVAGAQMLTDAAANVIAPGMGLASMGYRAFGSGTQEARQAGASIGQQLGYGSAVAAVEMATEKLADGLAGIYGKGQADDIVRSAIDRMTASEAGRNALNILYSAGAEAAEEIIAGVIDPALKSIYDGQSLSSHYAPETAADILHDALVGGILGGVGGSVSAIAGRGNANSATNIGEARDIAIETRALPQTDADTPTAETASQGVSGTQIAAPETGTAVPVHAGQATTIYNPYSGPVPVQTQSAEQAVTVPASSVQTAQENMQRAQAAAVPTGGRGFKTLLTRLYQQTFKRASGVPVFGLAFEGQPYLVEIGNKVPGKVISDPNLSAEKLALLDMLPDIVKNSKYAGSGQYINESSKKRPVVRYDYFETPVTINNKPYIAKFDIEVLPDVNNYRTHQIVNVDLIQPEGSLVGPVPTAASDESSPHLKNSQDSEYYNADGTIDPAQNARSVPPQSSSIDSIPDAQQNVNTDSGGSVGAAAAGFSPFSHAELTYGVQDGGVDAVRPDDAPVSTDGMDRVSRTVVSAKGAAVTPEEFVPLIENSTMNGGFSYMPITNSETTRSAEAYITRVGWDDALKVWRQNVRDGAAGAEITARGALLYNHAVNSGNFSLALDILSDYAALGTNTAQGLQAFRILKSLTPENRLYAIQKSVEQFAADNNIPDGISISEEARRQYLDARTEAERDAAVEAMQKEVAQQLPSTLKDKFIALRYVNMLGNFKTQIRNVAGNAGMQAVSRVKDTVAAAMEGLAYAVSGGRYQRTKALFPGRARLDAARADFANIEKIALGEGKYTLGDSGSGSFMQGAQDLKTVFKFGDNPLTRALGIQGKKGLVVYRTLEAYRRATNWAMEKGDVIFSRASYTRALAGYLKAHNVTGEQFASADWQANNAGFVDAARAYAIREAQEATFRDTNAVSRWVSKIGRGKDTPGWVRTAAEGVIPFRKTPANVAVRAEEYSPLGLINTAVKAAQLAKGADGVTGADVINQLAKTATGSMIFALGVYLRSRGLLRGGDDEDDRQQAFDRLVGHQNYAMELPDGTSYALDWLTPEAIPLFAGAAFYDAAQENGLNLKTAERAITATFDPMLQMSMLSGVNDALQNVKYSENHTMQIFLQSVIGYLTQGLTNTLVGQIKSTIRNERTTTHIDKDSAIPDWLQRQIGKASTRSPFPDFRQRPYIDAWGDTQSDEGEVWERALSNLLSPGYMSRVDMNSVERELSGLVERTGRTSIYPENAATSVTVDGKPYYFSADEYTDFARALGENRRDLYARAILSPMYNRLSSETKADFIDKMESYAQYEAKREYVPGYSGSAEMQKYAEAEELGIDPAAFFLFKADTKDLAADKDEDGESISGSKKAKAVDIISGMNVSPAEKDFLLQAVIGKNVSLKGVPWR